jgi:hypothetical protein
LTLIDGPVNVPLIAAGAVVAGACVAGAVAAVVAAAVAPELLVATGFELFVALAVAEDDDDEADALDVAPGPVTGPPAIFIALVVPN